MHSKSKLFTSWSQVLLSLLLLKAPLYISLGSTDQWGMGGLGPLHSCWAYASSQPGIYGEFIKPPWLSCLLWLYKISLLHESIACHKLDHSLTLVEPLALPVLLQLKVTILIKISKCSLISRDSKTPAFQGLPHPGWNATPIKLGMRKKGRRVAPDKNNTNVCYSTLGTVFMNEASQFVWLISRVPN